MSINSQIQRIKNNILAAYSEIDSKGGIVPSSKISDNLVAAIMSISTGGGGKFIVISDGEANKNNDHRQDDELECIVTSLETTGITPSSDLPKVESSLELCTTGLSRTDCQTGAETNNSELTIIQPILVCTQVEVS